MLKLSDIGAVNVEVSLKMRLQLEPCCYLYCTIESGTSARPKAAKVHYDLPSTRCPRSGPRRWFLIPLPSNSNIHLCVVLKLLLIWSSLWIVWVTLKLCSYFLRGTSCCRLAELKLTISLTFHYRIPPVFTSIKFNNYPAWKLPCWKGKVQLLRLHDNRTRAYMKLTQV